MCPRFFPIFSCLEVPKAFFELPQFSQCVVRVRPMTGANPRAAFAKKPLTTRHPAPDQGSIVCGCRQVLDLLCVLTG